MDEVFHVVLPVVQHGAGEFRTGIEIVLANQFVQLLTADTVLDKVDFHHIHITEVVEVVVLVPYIGNTARHTCCKVATCLTQHDDASACHILTAVVTGTLQYGNGTRVAHSEAFANLSVDI